MIRIFIYYIYKPITFAYKAPLKQNARSAEERVAVSGNLSSERLAPADISFCMSIGTMFSGVLLYSLFYCSLCFGNYGLIVFI